ncbi:NAD(P)H-dependent glycerol-3-phosphate dehydrogenase [Alloalcanivorax mobilis]|uniref:NAD(P)H-dependent glycerol-3-phosphate dehydrogenase n=1 Tax=Alloalcanivorax mobilis TaxID=2019569 RepID=UPI000B5B2F1E|nr:NAD(P)H-dependent glycerol-3-phosphate dehydrogenase [Alloalcanivorax mobilis]ASK34025.1 glycerol-3-phosphate dehydrogenase [Alcanivorax sp. N3-2A]|tara:strand:+ start:19198 stop:20229 length:1032 start_codon:yes stop_codon:yes gene_type:complete
MSVKKHTAAILGGGSFGTAMASILAENGHTTRLWVRDPETAAAINEDRENPRYLPGQALPEGVHATEDLDEVLGGADLIFVAVPSSAFVEVLRQARPKVADDTLVVSCTKGIHEQGFLLMSQLLEREWPHTRIGVLSGPNLAREIVERKFTGTVIASADSELCQTIQDALSCDYFRVYDNPDMYGVELGGALKNIYAVASGLAAAVGVGENSRSFMLTRALAEMSRFAVEMGANPLTFLGLAGVGDLIATCSSSLSRNYQVGQQLGQGLSLDQAVARLGQTAEGINTIKLVAGRARELNVYMPLASALFEIIYEHKPLDTMVARLMGGEHKHDVEFSFHGVRS